MEKQAQLDVGRRADRTINPELERWYAARAMSHTVEVAQAQATWSTGLKSPR